MGLRTWQSELLWLLVQEWPGVETLIEFAATAYCFPLGVRELAFDVLWMAHHSMGRRVNGEPDRNKLRLIIKTAVQET
jgi:hypothetical protein